MSFPGELFGVCSEHVEALKRSRIPLRGGFPGAAQWQHGLS
jgi:hypothetical protein